MIRKMGFLVVVFCLVIALSFCGDDGKEKEKEKNWLEQWKSAVVTLGLLGYDGQGNQQFMVIGTGFLVYNYSLKGQPPFLVTARHNFEPKPNELLKEIRIRFHEINQKPLSENLGYRIILVNKEGTPQWKGHPGHSLDNFIDVAAIPLKLMKVHEDVDILSIPYSNFMNTDSLFQSDAVMCLGYPGNVAYLSKTYLTQPVMRSGIVAWISERQADHPGGFLIDIATYGGNSGGPVFLSPVIGRPSEPLVIKRVFPKCVGLVSKFVPEIVFSRDPRGMFMIQMGQNTGLTEIVPTEWIIETLAQFGNPSSLPIKKKKDD